MTNQHSTLKSRGITLPAKVYIVKATAFFSSPVWMWELDHKGQEPKNWCFWTVVLGKILESPLDCKEIQPVYPKGGQSWIFTGRTDAEAETPYFSHLMWKTDSLEKTLMLGKIEGRRRRGQQRMRWLDKSPTQWTSVSANSGRWWRTGKPGVLQSMGLQRVVHDWATELNWTLKMESHAGNK